MYVLSFDLQDSYLTTTTQHAAWVAWNESAESAALSSTERVSHVSFARTSRLSFAADPRLPGESRRTRAFRSVYIPPVPAFPSDDMSDDRSGSLSPRQTQGPLTLTPED